MSSSSFNQPLQAHHHRHQQRPRIRLTKGLQEYLLSLLENKNTEDPVPRSEEPTPDIPTHLGKRRSHSISDQESPLPPPAKRARLSCDTAAAATALAPSLLHQPAPLRPPGSGNSRYASFLRSFVDTTPPPDAVFRPDWVSPFVYQWIKSPDQPIRPRSDSFVYLGDDGGGGVDDDDDNDDDEPTLPARRTQPVIRRAHSAPAMARRYDADGYAIPPTPTSSGSRGRVNSAYYSGTSPSGNRAPSPRSSVDEHRYRRDLENNGIHLLLRRSAAPDHITDLMERVRRRRESPGPTVEEIESDTRLLQLDIDPTEADVQNYFERAVFPEAEPLGPLAQTFRQPMLRHAVPSSQATRAISTPAPDMMYGYSPSAFSPAQQMQLDALPASAAVTTSELYFPFFLVEYKGQEGSLRVATNQCLGGSASCVHVAERLNHQLRQCAADPRTGVKQVDSAVFSVALNGTEARLFVSWKQDELTYHTAKVRSFALQEADHYLAFRTYARNIVDWGRDTRLREISAALDLLLEESRRAAAAMAKARSPPHAAAPSSSSSAAGSSSSRSKRHQTARQPGSSSNIGSEYRPTLAPAPASAPAPGYGYAAASSYDDGSGGGYGIPPNRGGRGRG